MIGFVGSDAMRPWVAKPAASKRHCAAQSAAHGQFFGQEGVTGLFWGQHSIGPFTESMPGIDAMPAMPEAWIATGAAFTAHAGGVIAGVVKKPIIATIDNRRDRIMCSVTPRR